MNQVSVEPSNLKILSFQCFKRRGFEAPASSDYFTPLEALAKQIVSGGDLLRHLSIFDTAGWRGPSGEEASRKLKDFYIHQGGRITLKDFRESIEFYGGIDEYTFDWFSEEVRSKFVFWMNQPLYLVFDGETRYKLSLGSKRGNRKFVGRGYRRLKPVKDALNQLDKSFFVNKRERKLKTKALFITLTVNPDVSLGRRGDCWQRISKHYDNFIRAVIKKYGKAFALRGVIESTRNGYPHIHLLMIFKEREFECFYYRQKYRIVKKRELEHYWGMGYIDVEAIRSAQEVGSYATKYAVKAYNPRTVETCDKEGVELTLAMNWYFRKHSFTFRYLKLLLYDLIYTKQNSHQEPTVDPGESWEFRGIITLGRIEASDRPPPRQVIVGKNTEWGREIKDYFEQFERIE